MIKLISFFSFALVAFFAIITMVSCNQSPTANTDADNINPTLQTIFARKSVRAYEDKEVEAEKTELLLRAAMSAPSGKDIRPWHFILINDRVTLDSLAAALPFAKMLANTRQALIVCGDSKQSFYWYLDCSAAAQNILLAAQSMGLGAVWTAAYPYEDRMQAVIKHTGLPEDILPLCVIPFGYPEKEEQPKDKFDKTRIHYNRF